MKPETVAGEDSAPVDVEDEDLLRSMGPGLVRLGRLLSGSPQLGEDLAQEAIIGMLRNAPVAEPRAYLRRSVINLSINDRRREVRERRYLHAVRDEPVPPPVSGPSLWS